MNGEAKHGDAVADKWRETFEKNRRETDLALTKLEVRAEMKSVGEEENSAVIDQRALEAHSSRQKSDPPTGHAKEGIALVRSAKTWPQAVVAVAVVIAVVVLALHGCPPH